MIQPYIAELQNRINIINELIGDLPENYEKQLNSAKSKVDDIVSKIMNSQDTPHKYKKLNNFINKHNDVLDNMLTSDKINIVLDQLDELKEISDQLNKIQKLLPSLNTEEYIKQRDQYDKIYLLNTASELILNKDNGVEVQSYDERPLKVLQQEERKQMSAIMELNYRMVNNLNQKIKLAYERKKQK